ncbi:MAG: elongation factor G [Dehalococcoidia bacterium]|nr:elongation factor G [Dehalococcoidia bacterium]
MTTISAKKTELKKVRNIGFIAHIDAGKTTVTERVLFFTGETYKIGNIDEGTTVMDFMSLERERGITIGSAATNAQWNDHQINIIDTPGHVDFTAEVERSLRVLDGGVVVLESVSGVQPQSETVWHQADTYHVPRLIFVNKMDRLGADFNYAVQTVRDRLGANAVPIQIPMGAESEFHGLIDLIGRKAYSYETPEAIEHVITDIPEQYVDAVEEARMHLVEKVAETDDTLMEKFLDEQEISTSELKTALRKATIALEIFPVCVGSALRHRGVHPLLDAVIDYLPSPLDVPAIKGVDPADESVVLERKPSTDDPVTALAFKVVTDQHVGHLVYLRVYSGVLEAGATVYNSSTRSRERVGRLMVMHADSREDKKSAGPGEIVAAIGLKDTATGQTLCPQNAQISLEKISFPDPVLSVAVEPKTRTDQDKMSTALLRLADEDPTLVVSSDEESGQVILAGMGELHLDVIVERMRREFSVDATVGAPRVAYRETVTQAATAQGKLVRQTGGHGQFGDCTLRLEPLPTGSGLQFESEITGSTLPREYFKPIEQGFREAARSGVVAGYPVVDLKAVLIDGSHHEVDSSEMAFKVAASMAFKSAMGRGKPALLEPIMKIEVVTPSEFLGDVLGDLNSRRSQVQNMDSRGETQVVTAFIPLAETFQYATHVRSITTGRASFAMELDHYSAVPRSVAEKVTGN